jgi:hypothetical protein
MTKNLRMVLNQGVSGKNVGKTIEIMVRIIAGTKGINPITINAFDTLPIQTQYI